MNLKGKLIIGIAFVLAMMSITLFASPIQAYVNGTSDPDMLQTQNRDRLRTCDCDGNMLQGQDQARYRSGTQNCTGNCTMKLEQYRWQYRCQGKQQ